MNAFAPLAPFAETAGELVDDDDFAVANDVLLVAVELAVDFDRLFDVFVNVVKAGRRHRVRFREVARFAAPFAGQLDLLFVVVVLVIFVFDEVVNAVGGPLIRFDFLFLLFGRERADDERRAGFVDENRVGFVDEAKIRLRTLGRTFVFFALFAEHRAEEVGLPFADSTQQEPVAEEVEAELLRGAVGNVALVGFAALVGLLLRLNDADVHPERAVNRAHQLGVAGGEVVVDGREEGAFPGQRSQVERRGRGERFSFAGLHFDDGAVENRDSAQNLNVEVAHSERSIPGFAHQGERFRQDFRQRFAAPSAVPQREAPFAQLVIVQFLHLRFERVDSIEFVRPARKVALGRLGNPTLTSSFSAGRYRAHFASSLNRQTTRRSEFAPQRKRRRSFRTRRSSLLYRQTRFSSIALPDVKKKRRAEFPRRAVVSFESEREKRSVFQNDFQVFASALRNLDDQRRIQRVEVFFRQKVLGNRRVFVPIRFRAVFRHRLFQGAPVDRLHLLLHDRSILARERAVAGTVRRQLELAVLVGAPDRDRVRRVVDRTHLDRRAVDRSAVVKQNARNLDKPGTRARVPAAATDANRQRRARQQRRDAKSESFHFFP